MARLNKETGIVTLSADCKDYYYPYEARLITNADVVKKYRKNGWHEVNIEGWYVILQKDGKYEQIAVRKALYNQVEWELIDEFVETVEDTDETETDEAHEENREMASLNKETGKVKFTTRFLPSRNGDIFELELVRDKDTLVDYYKSEEWSFWAKEGSYTILMHGIGDGVAVVTSEWKRVIAEQRQLEKEEQRRKNQEWKREREEKREMAKKSATVKTNRGSFQLYKDSAEVLKVNGYTEHFRENGYVIVTNGETAVAVPVEAWDALETAMNPPKKITTDTVYGEQKGEDEVTTETEEIDGTYEIVEESDDVAYINSLMDSSLADLTKAIAEASANARESVKTMAMCLYVVKQGKKYKEDGFKNVADYALETFGISKSTTHLYIQTVARFLAPEMQDSLPEGLNPSALPFAALQELKSATNEEIEEIAKDMPLEKTSAKNLRKVVKELHAGKKPKKEKSKQNGKDSAIERLTNMNTVMLKVLMQIGKGAEKMTAEQMAELALTTLNSLSESTFEGEDDRKTA